MKNALALLVGLIFVLSFGVWVHLRSTRTAISSSHTEQRVYLQSFYRDLPDYQTAFNAVSSVVPQPVAAGVTSHHFLAKELIARFFAGVRSQEITTIVVVSPDHYHQIWDQHTTGAITTLPWQTPYGVMEPNLDLIQHMIDDSTPKSIITKTDNLFLTEHGVYTLVPFAKKFFPTAKIVPLVLRGTTDFTGPSQAGKALAQHVDSAHTLVVVSSDFVHHSTASQSAQLDRRSIAVLRTQQTNGLGNLTSDCKVCMAFLFSYLANKQTHFSLIENKNSTNYGGRDVDVTSYVSGYFVPGANADVHLLFGGDLMFDRSLRLTANQKGYDFLFQPLHDLFAQSDGVIANLEGPITSQDSTSVESTLGEPKNYVFTFEPTVAAVLQRQAFLAVNLGNNHIVDFGERGVQETQKYLRAANMNFFGDMPGSATSSRVLIQRFKNTTVALVNYNQFTKDGVMHTLADIDSVRHHADIVVVYTHWGSEYQTMANQDIQTLAHQFIDHGADVIFGSHPHVVQQKEMYKGKTIYYSLGNLIFDQYFSPLTKKGLLVDMAIDQTHNLSFRDIPLQLQANGQTVIDK